MKKIASYIFLMVISFSVSATVYPTDKDIGALVLPSSDSTVKTIANAVDEEYSPSWLLSYVSENSLAVLDAAFSNQLSSLLPLSQPVFSKTDNGVKVKDLKNSAVLTFILDDDGKITALSIL